MKRQSFNSNPSLKETVLLFLLNMSTDHVSLFLRPEQGTRANMQLARPNTNTNCSLHISIFIFSNSETARHAPASDSPHPASINPPPPPSDLLNSDFSSVTYSPPNLPAVSQYLVFTLCMNPSTALVSALLVSAPGIMLWSRCSLLTVAR